MCVRHCQQLIFAPRLRSKTLFRHRVGDLDLSGDDLLLGLFGLLDHVRRDERAVVVVQSVGDSVGLQAVGVEAALELVAHNVGDDLVDGVVNALDHARQNVAGLDAVLVRVNADDECFGATVGALALLLDGVERAEAGVARRGEDNVRAFAYLREREFLALARIVPGRVRHADVVDDDTGVRINRLRPLLVADGEAVYESDVHAADEAERARLRLARCDHADEVRAFVLLEDERGDVRQVARAVNDGEVDVRVVLRHNVHYGCLGEADADDEVVAALGERAHRRLNRDGVAGLHVAQHYRDILRGALDALPRGGVERAVVLAADVEDDADANLSALIGARLLPA